MRVKISLQLNESQVAAFVESARACVRAGVLTAEEASVALVEALEVEVIEEPSA